MKFLLKTNLTLVSSPIPSVDFTGSWKNQLNSTMQIEALTSGRIRGKYITAVGEHDDLEEFELTGIATGDLLSFIVDFGKYGSLTAWTGQLTVEQGEEKIATLWHLAKNFNDKDEPDHLWSAIWTGADNFYRT
jgi:hypothetical protein